MRQEVEDRRQEKGDQVKGTGNKGRKETNQVSRHKKMKEKVKMNMETNKETR